MPTYRQPPLMTSVPTTPRPARQQRPDAPISPGALARITPEARTRELVRRETNTITGEWLERCRTRPPGAVIARVEDEIHAMVCEGIAGDDIRRGMALWMTKAYAPSTIPSFVNQAMNAQPGATAGPAKRDLRAAAAVEIGARLQAQYGAAS